MLQFASDSIIVLHVQETRVLQSLSRWELIQETLTRKFTSSQDLKVRLGTHPLAKTAPCLRNHAGMASVVWLELARSFFVDVGNSSVHNAQHCVWHCTRSDTGHWINIGCQIRSDKAHVLSKTINSAMWFCLDWELLLYEQLCQEVTLNTLKKRKLQTNVDCC